MRYTNEEVEKTHQHITMILYMLVWLHQEYAAD